MAQLIRLTTGRFLSAKIWGIPRFFRLKRIQSLNAKTTNATNAMHKIESEKKAESTMTSSNVLGHELLVEIGTQHIVDEFLLLVSVFCAACLVLEYNIVVPSPLHGEILRVE